MLPPVQQLNSLQESRFVAALAPLFENASGFLARLAAERPFDAYDALFGRAEVLAQQLPEAEQLQLINSHPRIGAAPGSLSAQSFREQSYDHDPGTAQLQARLDELNEAYEQRFGFRFVIFVAGRPRSEIARAMEQSLTAERDEEKQRALRDVIAIARDRATRSSLEGEEREA